ncbi:MAG: class I SAM-dependent rRNA methyltransferase [Planctomycetaceae bacterium]|nr:class I SAM-dependent rRNA methyltransferase [Planctomycetaceae bacterium]
MPEVILKPRKARPFYGRHPWVLDSAVDRVEGNPADGDVVDLLSDKGKFIARGVFNRQSRIRVRLYTWNAAEALDDSFWRRRLETALELRRQLGYDVPNGAARLVFSEGDGLSGLVVDRYGDYLALQVTAKAMAVRLPSILTMLAELTHPRGMVIRTERGVSRSEGLELRDGPCWGQMPDGPLVIVDQGLQYELDLAEGQKTGFYIDQRDNRVAAARYLRDRRVLDMFCYSGGFAMAASAHGGARDVLGVDASQKAVELAASNARRNGLTNVRFQCGDGFETLQALIDAGERFDAVVLDPPKFARSRSSLNEAMRAYHWLNRLAIALLPPGGVLVTCSCSGHVSREDFLYMLVGVAQQTGREIQVLEQRGPSPDHPVSAACLESEYLKCFICRVV